MVGTRAAIGLIGMLVLGGVHGPAHGGPLDGYAGRWAGWGKITFTNGKSEDMKCVTTYSVSNAGRAALQKFRCASASYRVDSAIDYKVSGRRVTGTWRETIFSVGGPLNGRWSKDGISVGFRAETFAGRLRIATSRCRQSIAINLNAVEVKAISVSVSRC